MMLFLDKGAGQAVRTSGIQTVVVHDDDGQPLAIMWHREDGTIGMTRVGEKDFVSLCSELSLENRVRARVLTL